MKFTRDHKILEVELKPLVKNPSIDIESEEPEFISCVGYDIHPQKKYAKIPLDQWELIVTNKDTDNLAKLKNLGYKEGAACRILDALGLE